MSGLFAEYLGKTVVRKMSDYAEDVKEFNATQTKRVYCIPHSQIYMVTPMSEMVKKHRDLKK